MSTTGTVNIDLAALEQEIKNLSPEEITKQLLEVRTKQRIQQKKYHNTDAQKAYRVKRAETLKLLAKRAKELGMYDQIREQANAAADAKLAEAVAEEEDAMAEAEA